VQAARRRETGNIYVYNILIEKIKVKPLLRMAQMAR
jgi:hypothetical protein